jgi:pSer/pThr/pTyr-binding forkhead associated (FHA) protein
VITLTLLHPLQSIPVQSWTFNAEAKIRIGRSTNNEVVLYSAVVSRHHVEIRKVGEDWEVVNLGANGTYIEGKRISQIVAADGMIVRLASSGPKILINIKSESLPVNQQDIDDAPSVTEPVPTLRRKIDPKDTLISED